MIQIKELKDLNEKETDALRKLLIEYGQYMFEELQLTAGKDSYWEEIKKFPSEKYRKPDGAFLLAFYNAIPVGCVGLRRYENNSCEMKRMYVNKNYRGLKIGEELCYEIIKNAKEYGYTKMLLDTNKEMKSAVDLYLKLGFKEIKAYCNNINPNPIYMEKQL